MEYRPLSVGIDDFRKVIAGNYYYVDKTWMIKELLDKKNEVNLFTRPRRFGKTLNMSMLRYFFEDTGNDEETRSMKILPMIRYIIPVIICGTFCFLPVI